MPRSYEVSATVPHVKSAAASETLPVQDLADVLIHTKNLHHLTLFALK